MALKTKHNARILEEKLNKIKGVASHRVETNNRRAVIEPDNGLSVLPEAVGVIRSMGYGVPAVKKTFPVLHLSCASCAVSAQSMVQAKEGVISACG
jgi:P-type Cu2+ transporter